MMERADLQRIHSLIPRLLPQTLTDLSEIAERIWQSGWAEANAGNLSIDITADLDSSATRQHRLYLVSRTGSRYRQYKLNPLDNLVLIAVDKEGKEQIFPEGCRPTSEWSSHRELQAHLLREGSGRRCILHTHPAHIIALSQLPAYEHPEALQEKLFDMLPEMKVYFPEGIALARYADTGTYELTERSLEVIGDRRALIWQRHGILSFGGDFNEAFDYMEIVSKAARLWFLLQRP